MGQWATLFTIQLAPSDDDADDASGDADEDSFDEELAQDVDTAGAYTHAQADFAPCVPSPIRT